jgi:hypothetical protein
MPWSKTRATCFAVAAGCLIIAGFMYTSSRVYTKDFDGNVEFWLFILVGLAAAIGWITARSRDQVCEKLAENRQQIEENRQALSDLQLFICEYGDQREASGHVTASRVSAIQQGRRLSPID